jgi:hypothetical protein
MLSQERLRFPGSCFENRDPLKGDGNILRNPLKTETRLKGMETLPSTPLKTETRLKGMETRHPIFENRDPLKGDGNWGCDPYPYFENRDPLKGDGNASYTARVYLDQCSALKTETRLKGMGESVLGSRSSAPGGGRGGTAVRHGGLYCSLLVTRYPSPVTRHSVTSSLRHFLNRDPLKGDGNNRL